jgi:hypothetical protein
VGVEPGGRGLTSAAVVPTVDHGEVSAEDARRIALHRRDGTVAAYTLVDAADFGWLSAWPWCLLAGGYAVRSIYSPNHATLYMHREILGLRGEALGDHINGDRLDNRRANLRAVGALGNAQNQLKRPGMTSRYRNVSWDAGTRKWMVRFCIRGKRDYLGLYEDEDEAGRVASAFRAANMPYSAEARSAPPGSPPPGIQSLPAP